MANRHFWYCNACGAQNSVEDGECQFCECGGPDCKRDSCSDPRHFSNVQTEISGILYEYFQGRGWYYTDGEKRPGPFHSIVQALAHYGVTR